MTFGRGRVDKDRQNEKRDHHHQNVTVLDFLQKHLSTISFSFQIDSQFGQRSAQQAEIVVQQPMQILFAERGRRTGEQEIKEIVARVSDFGDLPVDQVHVVRHLTVFRRVAEQQIVVPRVAVDDARQRPAIDKRLPIPNRLQLRQKSVQPLRRLPFLENFLINERKPKEIDGLNLVVIEMAQDFAVGR